MLVGVSTNITKIEPQENAHVCGRPIENPKPMYHVELRSRNSGMIESHEEVDYDGMIGCVSVSTGFVMVRRNGEECISGNTLGWLQDFIYTPWKRLGRNHSFIDVIQFKSTMNPAFPVAEYNEAKKTWPAWKFRQMYDGEFTRPAGAIYDCFESDIHTVKASTPPVTWPRHIGIDFGGVHTAAVFIAAEKTTGKPVPPGVAQYSRMWEECQPKETGVYHVYREYPEHNEWRRMPASGHVDALLKPECGLIPRAVGGAGSEDQWRDEFTKAGLPVEEPPIKEVEPGIDRVYGAIKSGKLIIHDCCTGLLDNIQDYSRELDDRNNPTDKIADKEQYHYADALRYVISKLRNPKKELWIA